jgi:hypothetical protein
MHWGTTDLTSGNLALAAKRAIERLMASDFMEARSKLTLQQTLGLIWLGINDRNALANTVLTPAQLKDRQHVLIKYLYEIQRGYNLNEAGVDDGLADQPICIAGTFNKLISVLEGGRHQAVEIYFVTAQTILAKMQGLVNSAFLELTPSAQRHIATQWTEAQGIPLDFLAQIKPHITEQLNQEFSQFREQINNYTQQIQDTLNALEWLNPTPAVIATQQRLGPAGAPVLTSFAMQGGPISIEEPRARRPENPHDMVMRR